MDEGLDPVPLSRSRRKKIMTRTPDGKDTLLGNKEKRWSLFPGSGWPSFDPHWEAFLTALESQLYPF